MANKRKRSLSAAEHFDAALTIGQGRKAAYCQMNMANKIRRFLDGLPYGNETIYRVPLRALHEQIWRYFDGAVFAAAMLQ